MKKILLIACMLLIGMVWVSFSNAESNDALYTVDMRVKSQDAKERQKAIIQALQQVFVKVSGSSKLTTLGALPVDLKDPAELIQRYSYQAVRDPESDETTYRLRVQFDPQRINTLLSRAGQAIWQEDRPVALVWLVVENDQGRQIISVDSDSPLTALLEENSKRRGIELLLPTMDLTDMNGVTAKDVWVVNKEVLQNSSKRYGADILLIGRLKQRAKGWQGTWSLIAKDKQINWNTPRNDLGVILASAIDKMVDDAAPQFAAVNTHDVSTQVVLTVSNVNTVSDYAKVMAYLKSIPIISQVDVLRMKSSNVVFELSLTGEQDALQKAFADDQMLLPDKSSKTKAAQNSSLNYQWSP